MSFLKLIVLFLFLILNDYKVPSQREEVILLGAGCFWNLEYYFSKVSGVASTACVYTSENTEAVFITYDPEKVSIESLVDIYFASHNPLSNYRSAYEPVIQCATDKDLKKVIKLLEKLENAGLKHKTKLSLLKGFRHAEEMHQKWFEKRGTIPRCSMPVKF